MSDYEWDSEPQGNTPATPGDGPKGLREAYERQKQANKELQDQLKSLSDKVRTSEVSSTLSSLGLPEKVAKLFPKEIDPSDKEAVKGWVDEYGDLFGSGTPKTPEPTPEPPKAPVDPGVIADELQKMNTIAQGAASAGPAQDLQSILNNPRAVEEFSLAQFEEVLRKNGARV